MSFSIIQLLSEKIKTSKQSLATFQQSRFFVHFLVGTITLFVLISSIIAMTQLPKMNTQYSLDQFFPTQHPLLVESRKNRQTFQLDDRPSYLMSLELFQTSKHWLTVEKMHKLKELTLQISHLPNVKNVFSMATLEGALQEKGALAIGPIYDRLAPDKWESFTTKNSLIMNQLLSADFLSTMISLEPIQANTGDLNQLQASLRDLAHEVLPEAKVRIGGIPAIQGELSIQLLEEFKTFALLSLLVFGVIFFVLFQGMSSSILTLTCLGFVNLCVAGLLCYLRIPFSLLLSTLPIVISVSVISIMIHTMHRWSEIRDKNIHSSIAVIKEMFKANFLGSLTTALGFLALSITPIPLISQYGWAVAMSVMITWVLANIMLVGFMIFTRPKMRTWIPTKATWSLGLLKKAPVVFTTILAFTIIAALAGTQANFSSRLFNDLPKKQGAREATEHIDESFGGAVGADYALTAEKDDFWKDPTNLKRLQDSVAEIKPHSEVGSILSVLDFFNDGLPRTQREMAEFLFLYSLSEANPVRHYLTDNGKNLRLYVRFHDLESYKVQAAEEKIYQTLTSHFPELKITETGIARASHNINQEVAKNLISNFWHAIVIVGLFLIFIFKSVRWAAVACLPNLIPPAILIGGLALMQTPIKPGVSLVFSIALGLAFNNTVYLLIRLQKILKESRGTTLPIRQALLQEGNPCLFETIVMFSGFSIFMASQFELNQTFGFYMLLSILAGGIGDLVFLPVTLRLFPWLILKGSHMPTKSSHFARASIYVFAILAASFGIIKYVQAAPKADDEVKAILKKVQLNLDSRNDKASITMKIIEANGDIKIRSMTLQTMRDNSYHALVRIQSPPDLKGTAFLAEVHKDKEDQWLYLPSTKQVRRVVGTKKSTGILGSELTLEDLNSAAIKSSVLRLLKKDAQEIEIEVVPEKGTSIYDKVILKLSSKEHLPFKTLYFIGSEVKKEVTFTNYKKFGSIYRALTIQVRNLANKRGTDIEISDVRVNTNLSRSEFTTNALKPN